MGMSGKRVLLCTYSAGYGHHKTAEAIKDAFLNINPDAGVYIVDPFKIGRPGINSLLIAFYLQMIKRAPFIYRFIYEKAETSKNSKISAFWWKVIINRKFRRAMNTLILREQPDIILCLHPFSAIAMRMWKNSAGKSGPVITGLLTDYTVHPFWWQLNLDGYFVSSPDLINVMTKHGIPPRRVWPVGIPVDSTAGSYRDKAAIRRSLGLNPETPTVLVMGGGLGLGGLDEIVRCLGTMGQEIQMLVVTGANPVIQENLTRLVAGVITAVKVFGFVNNVPELMAASDLIVTKPGGVTVAEALATGLPMIVWRPIPGQEERNTSFLVQKGLAVLAEDLQELVPKVRRALMVKPEANLDLALSNRSAASHIADIMNKTYIN